MNLVFVYYKCTCQFVLQNKDMFGNDVDWKAQAEKDGFAGFTYVGEVVEI